jgi:hypothetical protein
MIRINQFYFVTNNTRHMNKIINTVSLNYRRVNEITEELIRIELKTPKREFFCSVCYSCKNQLHCHTQGQFVKTCSNWARIE